MSDYKTMCFAAEKTGAIPFTKPREALYFLIGKREV